MDIWNYENSFLGTCGKCSKITNSTKKAYTNSAGTDQTASEEAV